MIRINLISTHRLNARRLRTRTRRWVVFGLVYSLLLLLGCVTGRIAWSLNDPGLDSALLKTQAQIETTQKTIPGLQARLDEAYFSLNANRELKEHPDWSLLLAILSHILNDDLILRECSLKKIDPHDMNTAPAAGNSGLIQQATDSPPQPAFRLAIKGMGRSQEAVSQLALRLEQTHLFTRVKLVDTNLEPFMTGKAIAFRVECTLDSSTQGGR